MNAKVLALLLYSKKFNLNQPSFVRQVQAASHHELKVASA